MFSQKKRRKKIAIRIIFILTVCALLYASLFLFDFSKKSITWGVTFSKPFAEKLGLSWQEVYVAMLDDLGVRSVRVNTYWDEIERQEGVYDFTDYDWQIEEAAKRGVSVVLIIGRRTARWPECHDPSWLKELSEKEKRKKVLRILEEEVRHFQQYENIVWWQVENEPLLSLFGECTGLSREFLQREVARVQALDKRPVMVTDSGELSLWLRTGSVADILGATLYRRVWNPYMGHVSYFLPPAYYTFRAWVVENFYGVDRVIISELQGEPWGAQQKELPDLTLDEQFTSFDIERFQNTLLFAKKTGFSDIYIWGVEWWYWLKTEKNDPSFWNEVKKLF